MRGYSGTVFSVFGSFFFLKRKTAYEVRISDWSSDVCSSDLTYDVVVTIPEDMQYEFLATPEDRTGSASLWLGSGMKMPAPKLPRLKYFAGMDMMNKMMKMNGDMEPMGMEM